MSTHTGEPKNTRQNRASVRLDTYPFHMELEIWVEATNILGTVESEHLQELADWFGELMFNICPCGLPVRSSECCLLSQ